MNEVNKSGLDAKGGRDVLNSGRPSTTLQTEQLDIVLSDTCVLSCFD